MKNSDMPAMPVIDEDGVLDCDRYEAMAINPTTATGLTKREIFAMHAMQALATNHNGVTWKSLAIEAVSIADSLLRELEK
jgi:hypothetical protein